jgi:hypothetical protein
VDLILIDYSKIAPPLSPPQKKKIKQNKTKNKISVFFQLKIETREIGLVLQHFFTIKFHMNHSKQ